jgi:hypothetical protein
VWFLERAFSSCRQSSQMRLVPARIDLPFRDPECT